jgi:glycosyltransferase involved in cell wall biosynthesis
MKILFYEWSWHSIGGGQKFTSKIAEHLSKKNEVTVVTLFPINKSEMSKYYSVDLSKIKVICLFKKKLKIPTPLIRILVSKKVSTLSKDYDIFFNADAQETIKPRARYNILYSNFFDPKWYRPAKNILDFFGLLGISLLKTFLKNYAKRYVIYCNSKYNQKWLKKLWNVDSKVINPPIEIPLRLFFKKENFMISTGRISKDKSYDFVIESFKEALKNKALKSYKLLICGKADDENYLNFLKKISYGFPIEFRTNLSNNELKEIYAKSKIFMQAKGLKIDEEKYPALLEHFGMTPVEAMSYGCVPIVLNKGGYIETVDKKTGFRFDNKKEAVNAIISIASNKKLFNSFSEEGIKRARLFSLQRMQKQFDEIFEKIEENEKKHRSMGKSNS